MNKRLLIAELIAIPLLRIIATNAVFSQTSDEPIHIATGLEWLTTGKYDLDVEHRPLARIAFGSFASATLSAASRSILSMSPTGARTGSASFHTASSFRHSRPCMAGLPSERTSGCSCGSPPIRRRMPG